MESKDIMALKEVAGALNSIPVAGKAYMSLMYNCISTVEAIAEKYRQAQQAAEAGAGMAGAGAGAEMSGAGAGMAGAGAGMAEAGAGMAGAGAEMAEAAASAATQGAKGPVIG